MPITGLELVILLGLVILLVGTYRVIRTVKPLIVNAVVGLLVLVLASMLGFDVMITPLAVLIVAIGGVPGAILVVLLAYLGIAFVPAVTLL